MSDDKPALLYFEDIYAANTPFNPSSTPRQSFPNTWAMAKGPPRLAKSPMALRASGSTVTLTPMFSQRRAQVECVTRLHAAAGGEQLVDILTRAFFGGAQREQIIRFWKGGATPSRMTALA
jgi:hypothetical protein